MLVILVLATTSARAGESEAILAEAESHYQRRGEPGETDRAILLYAKTLQTDPASYDAAWRLSRAYWYAGKHAQKDRRVSLFQEGIEAGGTAVRIQPRGCEGHFWTGVNMALLAEHSGKFKALGLVNDVKEALQTALDLNPDCECAGPQRVLGKFYAEIPWFKGGSKDKAIQYLDTSLERCPSDTQSRMFLAEIYLDQGKKSLAIQQLQLVLKQEPDLNWLPETIENKNIAKDMLNRMRRGN